MKYTFFCLLMVFLGLSGTAQTAIDVETIMQKVDENMSAETRIVESDMVIYGKRKNRTVSSKSYSEGTTKSFTEYLAPDREKGTKMLKLENRLWIYSPATDRSIQLSGHMLRQSVMGSDMSYEDMMEDRKMMDMYEATILEEEAVDGRNAWKLELIAKVENVAYHKRMIWVDQERFVPLREELYAKSGELLKQTTLSDIKEIEGRWFPTKINYKDVLKAGKGTDYIIKEIQFDASIPETIFSKGALRK